AYYIPPFIRLTSLCFSLMPRPPSSTLFPYTTLFRSSYTAIELHVRNDVQFLHHFLSRHIVFHTDIEDRFQSTFNVCVHVPVGFRSEEHTSELQSRENLVCRLLLEKKKTTVHTSFTMD